jgi:hypothetical protein
MLRKIFVGLLAALTTIAILGLVISVIMYFSLMRKPADYQPQLLSKPQMEQAEMTGYKKVEELYNHVNLMDPFVISFDQKMINDLLMMVEQRELIQKYAPKTNIMLHQPQVSFQNGKLRLMGQVEYKNRKVILTVGLKADIIGDGRLRLRLLPIQAGAVSLHKSLVQEYLEQITGMVNQMWIASKAGEKIDRNGGSNDILRPTIDKFMAALQELVIKQEVAIDSTFCVDDDILARIRHVEIVDGRVVLSVQPFPKSD